MPPASQSFREVVHCLGPDHDLVAIRTETVGPAADTGVLFLNAGVLHRIGPHRLHVTLARAMSGLGVTGLRIDLSGIGDSRAIPGQSNFRESAVQDIRMAMDDLAANCGLHHFILFGLCSGADNALAAAAVDARITGLVLIDAPAYATAASRRRHRFRRLPQYRNIASIPGFLLALLRIAGSAVKARIGRVLHPDSREGESERKAPPAADFEKLVTALVNRGTRILMIYSGALGARYNASEQIFETFPALQGRLEVAYFADANHVFTELAQRRKLLDRVLEWTSAFLQNSPVA